MVPENILLPDAKTIRADLEYMTARWGELNTPAVFEIRAFKEGAHPQTAKFAVDWMDDAVEWCESLNGLGFNIYAVRNPIRHDLTGSATDDDILAAFFLWADCDDGDSAGNVKRFDGPKYSAAVVTGLKPSPRVHVYWALEEPCTDLVAWRDMQTRIASHFNSDSSVVNPSRIMRVGGTVAYPAKHKIAKGYERHATTLRTQYQEPRLPVTLSQMGRVFAALPQEQAASTFTIDAGPAPLDRERIAIQALSGQEWNNAVLRLVGSYIRKGLSDAEIHALTEPLTLGGYTVEETRAEVQGIIDRTRANPKFEGAGQDEEPKQIEPTTEIIADFRIDDSDSFLADLQPLEYLIEGILPTGVVYSLTGYTGHGKTTLALQFALSIAEGDQFCERETAKGSVLVMAGENPYNLKWQYAAALAARGLQRSDVHFVQGHFSLDQWTDVLRAKLEAMPDIKLIIVDSLQAFFEGDSDNDNTQMVEMARKFRRVSDIESRPAMMIIAHPSGKTPSKDTLVPRGGGGFLNEIDGNLTVWSGDASQQTLHHSQKFRGAGFDPMEWVMQVHEFGHLTDSKGTPLKLPVSRPEMTTERANRENANNKLLTVYLHTVAEGKPLSVREIATRERVSRYRAEQVIKTARDEKLIRRHAKSYVITDGGKDFLEAENAGL